MLTFGCNTIVFMVRLIGKDVVIMEKKEERGKILLARAKKAKEKQPFKNFDKVAGKSKQNAKFGKVNFNG